MDAEPRGFEEAQGETPWCVQCGLWLKWPYHDECIGCLTVGGRPAETVSLRTVHWDTAVLHAVIRRKVATWESRHPGWELVPDMQRYFEDSTHPSKYVDRETTIGRKLAWTRFRVERKHPRGVRAGRLPVHRFLAIRDPQAVQARLQAQVPVLAALRAWRAFEQRIYGAAYVSGGPGSAMQPFTFDREALVQGVPVRAEPEEVEESGPPESEPVAAEPEEPEGPEEQPA